MGVYVSSHCKWAARYAASMLRSAGIGVVSTWHDGDAARTGERTEQGRIDGAARNVGEIASADALLLVASPGQVPGGKFVEAGVAIGLGKRVVVLGGRENNLMWHPLVLAFDGIAEAVASLQGFDLSGDRE